MRRHKWHTISEMQQPYNQPDRLPAHLTTAATFIAALTLYLSTSAPSVTFGDAGELTTSAQYLGVTHPPGYPLWVLLSHVWLALIPIGSPAALTNLFTSVCAAAAAAIVAWLTAETLLRKGLAPAQRNFHAAFCVLLGLSFTSARYVWSQAGSTRVYPLALLSLALCLLFLKRWRDTGRTVWFALLGFGLGCGIVNHQILLLALLAAQLAILLIRPPLGAAILILNGLGWGALTAINSFGIAGAQFKLSPGIQLAGITSLGVGIWASNRAKTVTRDYATALLFSALVLLGLASFCLLPFFSARNPPTDWGFTRSWIGWTTTILRDQYYANAVGFNLAQWVAYGAELLLHWSPLGLLLAVLALPSLRIRSALNDSQRWAITLLLFLGALGPCLLLLLSRDPELYALRLTLPFLAFAVLPLSLLIGVGYTNVVSNPINLRAPFSRALVVVCLLCVCGANYLAVKTKLIPDIHLATILVNLGVAVVLLAMRECTYRHAVILAAITVASGIGNNYPTCSQSHEYWASWLGNMLTTGEAAHPLSWKAPLPSNSVLCLTTDDTAFPAQYVNFADRKSPPQRIILTEPLFGDLLYHQQICAKYSPNTYQRFTDSTQMAPSALRLIESRLADRSDPLWHYPGLQLPTRAELKELTAQAQKQAGAKQTGRTGQTVRVTGSSGMLVRQYYLDAIIRANPDKEFYLDSATDHTNLWDNLELHGLLLHLKRTATTSAASANTQWRNITEDITKWDSLIQQILGDSRDTATRTAFSHLRLSAAQCYYEHRWKHAPADQKALWREATAKAYAQAFALASDNPTLARPYTQFLRAAGDLPAAVNVSFLVQKNNPRNLQAKALFTEVFREKLEQDAKVSPTQSNAHVNDYRRVPPTGLGK